MGLGGRVQPLQPVKHGAPNYIPMTSISSLALKELTAVVLEIGLLLLLLLGV